jgi:hypothetical protein
MHVWGLIGAGAALMVRNYIDWLLLTWLGRRSLDGAGILVANSAPLFAAIYATASCPATDLRYWAAAAVLGSISLVLAWITLPTEVKVQLRNRSKSVLPIAMLYVGRLRS